MASRRCSLVRGSTTFTVCTEAAPVALTTVDPALAGVALSTMGALAPSFSVDMVFPPLARLACLGRGSCPPHTTGKWRLRGVWKKKNKRVEANRPRHAVDAGGRVSIDLVVVLLFHDLYL